MQPYPQILHQSILSFYLTPIHQYAFTQKLNNTLPFHAVYHPSKLHDISSRLANRKYRFHAFYRCRIALHTSSHQSTLSSRFHAFCCFTILLHTFDSYTIHIFLNMIRCTFSVDLVVQEFSLIVTCVQEFKQAFPCFATIFILAFVFLPIRPLLNPKTILLIILPLSYILGSVRVSVCTISVRLIVEPFSLIDISVRMIKNTLPIGLIVFPLTLILAAVCPSLSPFALTHGIFPLALVCYSIIKLHWSQLCNFIFFQSRLNQLVILGSFTSLQQIFVSIVYLSITIGLWLYWRRSVLFCCGPCLFL